MRFDRTCCPGLRTGAAMLLTLLLAPGCGNEAPEPDQAEEVVADAVRRPQPRTAAELPIDWTILEEKLQWAYRERLDTLPIGDVIVALGRSFVGTPYEPRTLEIAGDERLVMNLEALDCVTFVENVLAMSGFVGSLPQQVLNDRELYRSLYRRRLAYIRYRGGEIDGYPSRLHYFSEWIADGQAKGIVEDKGESLGGTQDRESIDFMSTHPEAYAQLAQADALDRIKEVEDRLNQRGRVFIPEDRIEDVAQSIRNGDVIAATSTVTGLDVAHTGIALWIDGRLHLMHAPLVGEAVQISERPLAQRILEIGSQDGIMVARAVEPGDPQ